MPALDKLVAPVVDGAIEALWAQWRVLSPIATGRVREAHAIVDPEALILGSLALGDQERRLSNMVAWWAHTGSTLLSVQRMKNLARDHPAGVRKPLADFARAAVESGDLRWKSIAGTGHGLRARGKDITASPVVQDPGALVLRLRLGFGVGIKADVLAYMIGAVTRQTIPAMARETGYHQRAVRRAVEELVAGGFVQTVASSPASYRMNLPAWRALLEFGEDPPVWRGWHAVYSFVTRLRAWAEEQRRAEPSAYVLSSRARDLMEEQRPRLHGHLNLPSDRGHTGEEYLAVFQKSLAEVTDWMKSCV